MYRSTYSSYVSYVQCWLVRLGLPPSIVWVLYVFHAVSPLQKPRKALLSLQILTIDSEKRSVDFNWGSETIRGVNIGGWLVLEP